MPQFIFNKCPICNSESYKPIGVCDLGPFEIEKYTDSQIVKCADCDTIYVNPLPIWSEEDFSVLYSTDSNYFTQSEKWTKIREKDIVEYRFRQIEKRLKNKNKTLLEGGAGIQAYMAKYLSKLGWDITVQEPSPSFIEILKTNYPSFQVIDSGFLEINTQKKYSLIYLDSVMEHVVNPLDYARKCADLLEDGGIFYFISPNEHSFSNWAKTLINKLLGRPVGYLCPYKDSFHLIGFSQKSIEILAKKSGLKIVRYIRRRDFTWFHTLERRNFLIKYPLALFLYLIDLIGYGNNQEIMLEKPLRK
jgi:2-polyprenyl-3-methyl-5-hydroxy-6-metoxy-1,4-benzoquinol methylase